VSSVAYAAVVYIRITSLSGEIITLLLASKSKVAPIKPMSIPRLELSAAVLLARLMSSVHNVLNANYTHIYCWTDSTVVLAWLDKHPAHWKTFMAHRVAAVHFHIPDAKWCYVPTKTNPADCASRGLLNIDIASHHLW